MHVNGERPGAGTRRADTLHVLDCPLRDGGHHGNGSILTLLKGCRDCGGREEGGDESGGELHVVW